MCFYLYLVLDLVGFGFVVKNTSLKPWSRRESVIRSLLAAMNVISSVTTEDKMLAMSAPDSNSGPTK